MEDLAQSPGLTGHVRSHMPAIYFLQENNIRIQRRQNIGGPLQLKMTVRSPDTTTPSP